MSNTQTRGTKKKLLTYYLRLRKFFCGSANKNYLLLFMLLSLFHILALIVDIQSEASEFLLVHFLSNIVFFFS
jgi:hypothetical protein